RLENAHIHSERELHPERKYGTADSHVADMAGSGMNADKQLVVERRGLRHVGRLQNLRRAVLRTDNRFHAIDLERRKAATSVYSASFSPGATCGVLAQDVLLQEGIDDIEARLWRFVIAFDRHVLDRESKALLA